MSIVTSTYRYKPPPKRKRRKLAEITGPRIVTSVDPKKLHRPATRRKATPELANDDGQATSCHQDMKSAIITMPDRKTVQHRREQQQMPKMLASDAVGSGDRVVRKSAIVTARRPGKAIPDGLLPDTPEEHQRRGDAADALWRELVRRATGQS